MDYIEYYDTIVKKRESCRNFSEAAVEAEKIDELKACYDKAPHLVEGVKTEIAFIDPDAASKLGHAAGYNGFLIKAPKYLVLCTEDADHAIENAGFIGQALTLCMTELGLAACWQTINDEKAASEALGVPEGMHVAVVIAFGYRDKEKGSVRLDIKSPSNVKMTKSGTKAAPKISLDEFLSYQTFGNEMNDSMLYSDLESALRAMSCSQSFFNRQPYRVIVDDDMISLVGKEDDLTNESDQKLNYGIAMFDFYAVMASVRKNAPKWDFEDSGRDLKLPEGYFFVAKARI